MKKIIFDIINSTQTYVKENIDKLSDTYVVAKTQSQGRGRLGRTWISNDNNLMFSFCINPSKLNAEKYSLITLLTGISLRDTLSEITEDDLFQIKWPNDIVYDSKKVCGIIAEGVTKNDSFFIVIGIGINVNQEIFDDEIKDKATSLKIIKNKSFNNDEILNLFDIKFKENYTKLNDGDVSFIEKINKYNYLKNKRININNEEYKNETFVCIKVCKNGCLELIDKNEKKIEINSNEVTLHNNY